MVFLLILVLLNLFFMVLLLVRMLLVPMAGPPLSAGPVRSGQAQRPCQWPQTGGGLIGGFHHPAPAGPWCPLPTASADWKQQASPPFGHKQINGKPRCQCRAKTGPGGGGAGKAAPRRLAMTGGSQVKGESCVGRREVEHGGPAGCISGPAGRAAGRRGHWPLPAAAACPARRTEGCQPTPS